MSRGLARRAVQAAAVAALAWTVPAAANGRFPASSLVVFEPGHPQHLVVRTTFGLFESHDDGQSFDFICESALHLGLEEDPVLAFNASGGRVVSTLSGILTSADGCDFSQTPELMGEVVPDLAYNADAPDRMAAFSLRGTGGGRYESLLWRSVDGGRTWSERALALPEDGLPLTVDVGGTDPEIVYLSARLGPDDDYSSALFASDDGGETFGMTEIPESSGQRLGYIAKIHPGDADRVYVRVDDPDGTELWESRDRGQSFERRFSGNGRLSGFAISPDGASLALGGPDDGIWAGEADAELERRSDVGALCLGWAETGLYACADTDRDGFSLGRSRDGGESFASLFRIDELCGKTSCSDDTEVGLICPIDWAIIAPDSIARCDLDEAPVVTARGGCALAPPLRSRGGGLLLFGLVVVCAGSALRRDQRP